MNAKIVRTAVYSGLIGVIIGVAIGVILSTAELRWLHPEAWYRQGGFDLPTDARVQPIGDFLDQFDLSNLTVPEEHLLRGGPPKDAIPALTNPETVAVDEADFLQGDDRIVAVSMHEESRAYPIRMLNWHEIVNDELGGVPIAVVYCPLCDSVTVTDRRIEGETLTFGVSGLLYQSNVLMYDRQHNGLWSQIMLEAVSGPHAGTSLRHYDWSITTYNEWRESAPGGTVVTFETGHQRDYHSSPYDGYMRSDDLYFPIKRDDGRLDRKARVIGVRFGDVTRAYPLETIHAAADQRLIDEIHGERVVIDADRETGRVEIREMPGEAQTIHTFWFSWAATHPETEVYGRD